MPRPQLPPRSASPDVVRSYLTADQWSRSPAFQRAFDRAMSDPKDREFALADASGYLEGAGAPVPPGLDINFLEVPPPAMPGPDFEQYSIRLFNCRTYFVQERTTLDKPRKWSRVQVCFGFEIVRNPGPGPIGH